MKILRKINKGFVLTIIVLIALITYLGGIENQRAADKESIVKSIENFIKVTDKYSVYPDIKVGSNKGITEEQAKKYEEELKKELEKVMISNKDAIEIQSQILWTTINIFDTQEVKTESKRKITKIKSYEFDNDQVTVEFNSILENTIKYLDEEDKEQTKQDSLTSENDEIVLQKIGEEWKVVYSNFKYNQNKYYEDMMMY